MNKSTEPLTLPVLQVNAYTTESTMATTFSAIEMFDDRKDFSMRFNLMGIAVLMNFCNEKNLLSEKPKGIRRKVSVAMIDATEDRVMSERTLKINIPKEHYVGIYRIDFRVTYGDIDPDHRYLIKVRDETSGEKLGEKEFLLFDELALGCEPEKWYHAVSAGIYNVSPREMLKSADVESFSYCNVRFNLLPDFRQIPATFPELELRIHFHSGEVKSHFEIPKYDEESCGYFVEHSFLTTPDNKGVTYAEIICMDFAVAGFVFSTSGPSVPGCWRSDDLKCLEEISKEAAEERLRDSDVDFERRLQDFIETSLNNSEGGSPAKDGSMLAPLDDLTGLKSVKEKLLSYEKMVRFNKLRRDAGLPTLTTPLHSMFLGSPGTGKTTVANLMGKMLKRAGLLSGGHVVLRERSTLLGPNYSMEETNTLKAIEEAQGGILFIDEAYQLYQPEDKRDPGKFVIETLMSALADESKRDWMLILAGYPDEMKRMFDLNPGLKSRFPDSNIYVFEDFSEPELMEIAERYLNRYGYYLSIEARERLFTRLGADYANRDKRFGNARHVINLIQTEILPAMAERVVARGDFSEKTLSEICLEDIPYSESPVSRKNPHIGFRA